MVVNREFLEVLFPDLNDGFIEIRTLHRLTNKPEQYYYHSIEEIISDHDRLESFSKECHMVFGICPRALKKGTKDAVKVVNCLWVDLDAQDFKGGKPEILDRVKSFPILPTIVVDSGNGFHLYWRLKESVIIKTDQDVFKIEAYLKAIGLALNGDPAVAELARVFRLPGSFNYKNKDFPKEVLLSELNSRQQCNLGDFDSFLTVLTPEANNQKINLNGWIAEALSNMREGNRNVTFAKIIGRLHSDGLSSRDIFSLLRPLAMEQSFPLEELQREIDGFKRYPQPASPAEDLNSHNSLHSQPYLENKWPEPPRNEAYYGLVGDLVRAIEPHTESDSVAILIQALIAFGNIIGKTAYFAAEADKHYLNIFAVLVGSTSKGRKGTSLGQIKRLFSDIEPVWSSERIQSGLSSGEGLIWAVRDRIERTESIKHKGKVVGDQNVLVDAGISDKRLLDIETEFASTLRVIGRDGNTLSPLIRQAWDDGILRVLTKNSPAKATNAHISIIGHITKGELLRYLDRTETANGFANRFLWVCVKRSKLLPDGGQIKSVDFEPIVQRLREAIRFSSRVQEIKRDDSARALWYKEYERLSKEKLGLQGALTARAEPQVMRLACIYALYDCSDTVRWEHLTAALALWNYIDASIAHIFGDNLGDPIADTILASLRSNPNGLSRTEISNLFKRHVESAQIARALVALQEYGLVEMQSIATDGRSKEVWFASAKKAKEAKKEEVSFNVEEEPGIE